MSIDINIWMVDYRVFIVNFQVIPDVKEAANIPGGSAGKVTLEK